MTKNMKQKRFFKLPVLAVVIVFGLFVATVFFAIKSSSQGANLVVLENKAMELEAQNQEVKDKIVGSTSLTKIEKDANDLGMVKPEKFIYLKHDGVALR